MGIWIRSQDKLSLREYGGICIDYHGRKHIYGDAKFQEEGAEPYFVLGEYETEERAIAVLDEIQEAIEKEVETTVVYFEGDTCKGYRVFQMPEK